MDTVLFPYNSMFAIDFNKRYIASAYSVKINGVGVLITRFPYWKKDFLEETLTNYGRYKKNNDALFMDAYLNQRISNETQKSFLLGRLTPDKHVLNQWLFWYTCFAGYKMPHGAVIELFKYDLIFENHFVVVTDSSRIYKTIFL